MEAIHRRFQSRAPGIKTLTDNNLTLLGAPLTEAASDAIMMEKLDALKLMGERLAMIDSHDALFLLKNCFAIPKLTYFLRTAPFFKKKDILHLYDEELKNALETILNVPLEGDAWIQCTLPVKKGGLGICKASEIALPAFLSSAHRAQIGKEALQLAHINKIKYELRQDAEIIWKESLNNDDLQNSTPTVQASWDAPLIDLTYNQLLTSQTRLVDRARLLAVAAEHASD